MNSVEGKLALGSLRPGVMDYRVSLVQVVMDLRTHLERPQMKASISSESV